MRRATVKRTSKETRITVCVNLDPSTSSPRRSRSGLRGRSTASARTGLPFLDHMLTLLGTHGRFGLTVRAQGDLEVDVHHTNEDVGIVLGQAVLKALGDARGIRRFGWAYVPMEEALARVVLDVSGRPKLVVRDQRAPKTALRGSGTPYRWDDLEHWLESFARAAKLTVHVDLFAGRDFHHACEAVVKALGRALSQAVERDPRVTGIPSSKGRL